MTLTEYALAIGFVLLLIAAVDYTLSSDLEPVKAEIDRLDLFLTVRKAE